MKKILWLQILFLLRLQGQIPLPYRENFKWGISEILAPKYDFVTFYKYPFYRVYYEFPEKKNLFNMETKTFVFKDSTMNFLDFSLFKNGFIRVKNASYYALFDYAGKQIHDFAYHKLISFEDSLFLAKQENEFFVLFPDGKKMSFLQYEFSKINARELRLEDRNILKNNKLTFKGLKTLKTFRNSLWCAGKKSFVIEGEKLVIPEANWTFFNSEGTKLFSATNFKENPYGVFVKRNKWGMINFRGKNIVPYAYDSLYDFRFGFAVSLQKRGLNEKLYGIIDSVGNRILSPYYYKILILSPKFAAVADRSKRLAIFSLQGKQLTPFVFNECKNFGNFFLCKIRKPYNLLQTNFLKRYNASDKETFHYFVLNKQQKVLKVFSEKKVQIQGKHLLVSDGFTTEIYDAFLNFSEKIPGDVRIYSPKLQVVQKQDSLFLLRSSLKIPVLKVHKFPEGVLVNTATQSYFLQGDKLRVSENRPDSVVIFGENFLGITRNRQKFLADFSLERKSEGAEEIFSIGDYAVFLRNGCYEFRNQKIACNTSMKILNDKLVALLKVRKYEIFNLKTGDYEKLPVNILEIYPFSGGLARIRTQKGWNFLKTDFSLLSPTFFEDATDFHNGFAYVKKAGKTGILNERGKVVFPEKIIGVNKNDKHFRGSFHVLIEKKLLKRKVRTAYRWVFLDYNGKELFKTLFPPASYLTPAGYAIVKNGYIDEKGKVYNGKWGWEQAGKLLLKPRYDSTGFWQGNYVLVKHKNAYGLYDVSASRWKLKPEYEFISAPVNGHFFVVKNKRSEVFSYDFEPIASYEKITALKAKYFLFQDGKYSGVHNYQREILRVPYMFLFPFSEKYLKVFSEIQFWEYEILRETD